MEAVDIDILGVEATVSNAKLNCVDDRIVVHHGDLVDKLNSENEMLLLRIF